MSIIFSILPKKANYIYFALSIIFCAGVYHFYIANDHIAEAQTTQTASVIQSTQSIQVEELKKKIEEQNRNIEALNKEIQAYSELKDKTTKEAQTLQALIKELDQNAKVLELDIKKTRSQIDAASLEINRLDLDIKSSEEAIADYRLVLRESLKQIQSQEDINMIASILAQRNFSDTLIEISNRLQFNQRLSDEVDELRLEKKSLQSNKDSKEKKKDELSDFQTQLADKKKVVEYNKNEKNKTLSATKSQEQTYQQILKQKQELKAAFEKELFNYESTLKYTLDPSTLPKSGTGALSWPLDKVIITQNFGKTVAAKRLYVSGSHNGVDFGAPIGTSVKAAQMGTVVGTGDTDITCPRASFGRWILIKHPNGLATIYAHLSVISVKEGDKVTTGQTIGYSGNTGYSTGPHLHISVYASDAVNVENRPSASCNGKVYRMPIAPVDAYLDPMLYFPKP